MHKHTHECTQCNEQYVVATYSAEKPAYCPFCGSLTNVDENHELEMESSDG